MSERTIKSGGVAGVLAAALFILSAVTDTVAPIDVDYDSPNEYVYVAASTVAFLAVVVAVIGVRALAARTGRPARLATVAARLVGVGYGAVGLLNIVNLLVGGRSLVMVRLGFAVVILVGSAILGWSCSGCIYCHGGAARCWSSPFQWGISLMRCSPARRIFCWHCCGGGSASPCWFARRHLSSRPWGSRHGLVDAGTARQPVRGRRQLRQTRPGTEEVYGIAVSRKGSQWTCSRTRRWFGTCSR